MVGMTAAIKRGIPTGQKIPVFVPVHDLWQCALFHPIRLIGLFRHRYQWDIRLGPLAVVHLMYAIL